MARRPEESIKVTKEDEAVAERAEKSIDAALAQRTDREYTFPLADHGGITFVVGQILQTRYRTAGWHVYFDHDRQTMRLVQP